MIDVLETYKFEDVEGSTLIAREAHWRGRPDHAVELADQSDRLQSCSGDRRRLHDGAETLRVAPLNAIIWSEVMHAAGVPAGVYNMVQRRGRRGRQCHVVGIPTST